MPLRQQYMNQRRSEYPVFTVPAIGFGKPFRPTVGVLHSPKTRFRSGSRRVYFMHRRSGVFLSHGMCAPCSGCPVLFSHGACAPCSGYHVPFSRAACAPCSEDIISYNNPKGKVSRYCLWVRVNGLALRASSKVRILDTSDTGLLVSIYSFAPVKFFYVILTVLTLRL